MVVDRIAQAQADGYHDYFEGVALIDCEYDCDAEPELYDAWFSGWEKAFKEEVDTDEGE